MLLESLSKKYAENVLNIGARIYSAVGAALYGCFCLAGTKLLAQSSGWLGPYLKVYRIRSGKEKSTLYGQL
jgi:hypothetical protein